MDVVINRDGFDALSSDYIDVPNIASPWSASFNFDGSFYIGSEFNGMEGFDIGDVVNQGVVGSWNGEKRRDLVGRMGSGEIKTLQHYKLRGINDLLLKVRKLGKFTKEEVDEFYNGFDTGKARNNVNFV